MKCGNILSLLTTHGFLEIDWERQWPAEDDQPGTRRKREIGQDKMMLTIPWNPHGLHLIDAMPKKEKYSTRHYVDNILTFLCQRLMPAGKCKLIIHADNALCHVAYVFLDFVSQRKVRFVPHPPYSPDIAPSDFFLFGDLENASCEALVFRWVRSFLLGYENR
jgi:histone-lysine N-methyltransferase SETMAR